MKNKKQHLTPGSYTADFLVQIGDAILDICEGLEQPRLAAFHGLVGVRDFKRAQLIKEKRQAYARLKRMKMIEERKIGDKMMQRILKKGLEEYFFQKISRTGPLPEGYSCLVVFDIPETRRDVRQKLRRLLTSIDFFQIQKSVWASPFDAAEELSRFLEIHGEQHWVTIYTAKRHGLVQ